MEVESDRDGMEILVPRAGSLLESRLSHGKDVGMERTRVRASAKEGEPMTFTDIKPVSVERSTCRSCTASTLERVIGLGNQYLVNFVKAPDLGLPRSPLTLMRCTTCGLLQLSHTVDPELLYREFWYRSSINATMRDALSDLVKSGTRHHVAGTWLDIGANDGYLLSVVPDSFRKIACEPALNFRTELSKVSDAVISDFFTAESVKTPCEVITSAAMFYDLDDPNRFVTDIAKVLTPEGVWINQLNDAPTMLRSNAFDAICHEHLCYYDLWTLSDLYLRNGMTIIDVSYNDVNGGSVRVVAKHTKAAKVAWSLLGHQRVTRASAASFADRVMKWKDRMTELVRGPMALHGPIWLYGASTKGCCLLQYLDCTDAFHSIADRNPAKHGLFMAGTWLRCVPEASLRDEAPRFVLALPWAFRDEFVERERPMLDAGTTMVFPLPNIEQVL